MDEEGRVTIPQEVREKLGFVPGEVELFVQGPQILLTKHGWGIGIKEQQLLRDLSATVMGSEELKRINRGGPRITDTLRPSTQPSTRR